MNIPLEDLNKWIEALRSGEYKQSKSSLQNNHGYCCLGVACKVLIPKSKLVLNAYKHIEGGLPGAQVFAPKWLKKINSDFADKANNFLSQLNDGECMTFDEIADCLELVYIHKILD